MCLYFSYIEIRAQNVKKSQGRRILILNITYQINPNEGFCMYTMKILLNV